MGYDITALAADIGEHHRLAQSSAAKAVEHVRIAGELLLKVKASLPHGDWLPWLEQNVSFAPRTAQRYMNAAAPTPKYDRLSHLKRKPSAPPPRKKIRPGSLAAKRLRELSTARQTSDVVAHALYVAAELPAVSMLADADLDALRALRKRIDEVLRRGKIIDV